MRVLDITALCLLFLVFPQNFPIPLVLALASSSNGSSSEVSASSISAIVDFLSSKDDGAEQRQQEEEEFHVNTWRWQTMSLIRENGRLEALVERLLSSLSSLSSLPSSWSEDSGMEAVQGAVEFVIEFDMEALHRIESKWVIAWLRDNLAAGKVAAGLESAFDEVIDKIEFYRQQCAAIGQQLLHQAKPIPAHQAMPPPQTRLKLQQISKLSSQLSSLLTQSRHLQETYLIPSLTRIVPASQQRRLNYRLLFQLGFFDGRVHLVSMKDAIWESNDLNERRLFETHIPTKPRQLVDKWRLKHYFDKTSCFDYGLESTM